MGAPGEQFWIDLGRTRLEAMRWTARLSGRSALLLLHEGLGSAGLWRDFPASLAALSGREVLVYSRPGYGYSGPCTLPRPLDYMEREAHSLPALVTQLGLKDYVLLGHSDGASIAALAAANQPKGLRGLILMAPHFFVEDISIRAIRGAQHAYETGDLRNRLARHHADPDMAFRGWNNAWLDPGFRSWDITKTIESWEIPVLALQGNDDPYGTSAQVNVIGERARDADVHLLPDCGHAPHLESRDRSLELISTFLDRIA